MFVSECFFLSFGVYIATNIDLKAVVIQFLRIGDNDFGLKKLHYLANEAELCEFVNYRRGGY